MFRYRSIRLLNCAFLLLTGLVFSATAADLRDMGAMSSMAAKSRPALGSAAAFAPDGRLFAVSRQGGHLMLYVSQDEGAHWRAQSVINAQPEVVSAEGENRPKLAFAQDGGILVSWTRPMSKPYSGEIRLARSDDGLRFADPITVHRHRAEITHRFDSLLVGPDGRVVVAWIDKRDLEAAKANGKEYRGAAIYAAQSRDGGRSFAVEQKVADHSCECCRIAVSTDPDGAPVLMWRHVFAPNERDHALVRLNEAGRPEKVIRVTHDRWRLDGCPHHGGSLSVAPDGTRHAVWFNIKAGEPHVFYGRLPASEGEQAQGQRTVGGARAEHADLALAGKHVVVAWKEFDGQRSRLYAEQSTDGGQTFAAPVELASTEGESDHPRTLIRGTALFAFWNTEREGMRVFPLP